MYTKDSQNIEACNRREKKCDELFKCTFPGVFYKRSKSILDKIDKELYDICEKKRKEMQGWKKTNSKTAGNSRCFEAIIV